MKTVTVEPLIKDMDTSDYIMVTDLAFIVRRLAWKVRKHDGDSDLVAGALEYLKRKGLTGSAYRRKLDEPAKENDYVETY